MNTAFDLVGSVSPGRDSWRIKVRVLRLWTVYSFIKPDQVNSIEMVLIDEKGSKIHASVRRQLLYLFTSRIVEGNVYKMSHFTVTRESGLYRSTSHPYKLNFEMKTKVQISESSAIDRYGLSLTTIGGVVAYGPDHDFLVDVVALITGISPEREYIRDGKVIKMILLELTDNSGKLECALFGDYVKAVQDMVAGCGGGLPVAVVQFAKIKIFGGKISIQNVLNTTRIYVNPSIAEVVSFKKELVVGVGVIESAVFIPVIGPRPKPALEDDFLINYPKTSIANLVGLAEDGIYVVSAVVDDLVEAEDWWYPSCRCHRSLSADSGAYYCKYCVKHVFKMVPRFRVKLRVDDGTAQGVFVVFDADVGAIVGKHCFELVAASKAENAEHYPPELEMLKGKKFLFKVEKKSTGTLRFDDSFRVKRMCSDLTIIAEFDAAVDECDSEADDDDNEAGGDEEIVDDTQDEDFVADLMVTPPVCKHEEEVVGGVINLDDDSNNDLEIFVPGRLGVDLDQVKSTKRNLSAAFSECVDAEASISKESKVSEE